MFVIAVASTQENTPVSDMNGQKLLEIIGEAVELVKPELDAVEDDCRRAGSIKLGPIYAWVNCIIFQVSHWKRSSVG